MELRQLARAVLLGTSIDEKLVQPIGPLTDERPGTAPFQAPPAPGRPPALRLDDGRPRARFPGAAQLIRPEARGRALHFFANHELLAMELMALVLLRFPNAPEGFRRGVAHTLLEEQDHLRRYRERMNALGVELGDVPVSDFFWSTMADMASPLDYVVRMSMTFEQANLDHARHYAALFRQLEDHATADLMDLVYEEELGHVRHGVIWFNRWRTGGAASDPENDWDAYRRLLPAPLSPRRAKGHPYVFDARLRVGLSETFAKQLEICNASRGRPPRVWLFEPDFEARLERPTDTPSGATMTVARDLAAVLIFLAAADDVVVTPVAPSAESLSRLTRAGFQVPELLVGSPTEALDQLADRPVSAIEGWGDTPTVREGRRRLNRSDASPPLEASSKLWAAEVLRAYCRLEDPGPPRGEHHERDAGFPEPGPAVVGRRCSTSADVLAARDAGHDAGFEQIVVKRPWSASGQARRRFPTDGSTRDIEDDRWLRRALTHGPVLVEPWLDRRADLSVLLDVSARDLEAGPVPRVTAMRFLTGHQGVYRGHVLADPTFGLPEALKKRLAFGAEGGFAGRLNRLGAFVRRRLAEVGHRGPAAIDLMIYRPPGADDVPEAWAVKPIVEINARRTMGHVAAALRTHLAPGRLGVWLFRPVRPEDAVRVAEWPTIETVDVGRRRRLVRGLLPTTDPASSDRLWTFLAVGRDLDDIRSLVSTHLGADALMPLAAAIFDAGAPSPEASGPPAPGRPSLRPWERTSATDKGRGAP